MNEQWRPVVDYEGIYEVSDRGRVRSVDRVVNMRNGVARLTKGRELRYSYNREGYRSVGLWRDNQQVMRRVHKLVARAFLGESSQPHLVVCHTDGDLLNNAVANLRWDTQSENNRDAVKHGTHFQASKQMCPRGHLLTDPNLVACQTRRGKRNCLACSRAKAHIRGHALHVSDLQPISDSYYADIMRSAA